jgi:hypothetical protein
LTNFWRAVLIPILLPALLLMSSVSAGMVICFDQGGSLHIETVVDDCCAPGFVGPGLTRAEPDSSSYTACEECSHFDVDLELPFIWQGFAKSQILPIMVELSEQDGVGLALELDPIWAVPAHLATESQADSQRSRQVSSTIIRC